MAERRTTVDGLADAIMDGLKEYADLATDTVKDAVKDVSKTVKKDIQANAPKRTGRYKKSWAIKKTAESSNSLTMTVHSKDRYQIAHLLEHGHAKRGGGRVAGREHIAFVTHEEVMAVMEEIGLPYAYHHFAEGESPDPPFAVFLYPGSNNFSADGKVYFKTDRLNIEIYTDIKNIELEQQTEAVLDGHDIFYEKSEVWIESENLYEVLYQMEV